MRRQVEFQDLLKVIKPLLKERGLKYKDVASSLSLSESSVKKIFTSEDCSLERIGQLCDLCGIRLAELFEEAENREPKKLKLTPAQDKYLVENALARKVFFKLANDDYDFQRFLDEKILGKAELVRILNKMDKLGLIRFMSGDKIFFPSPDSTFLFPSGRLYRLIKKEWAPRVLNQISDLSDEDESHFRLMRLKLTKSSLRRYIDELKSLELKYIKISSRESKFSPARTEVVAHVDGVGKIDINDFV